MSAPARAGGASHDLPRRGLARGFGALTVRNYRLYWIGQVLTVSGAWMQQVSLPWLVLALGGSPLQLGAVAVLQFGPAFFLAPLGGVLADRIDKRRALVLAHAAGVVQAFVLFVLTATGSITVDLILAMALWLGLINGIEMPVRHSFAPDLVPRRLLPNAIALQGMAFNSARVLGPAFAGAVIGLGSAAFGSETAGVATTMAVSVVAYSAVLVALVRMDQSAIRATAPAPAVPVLRSLGEGIAFARTRSIIFWLLALMAGISAFGFNFQILLPVFSHDVLRLDAAGYGLLFSGLGVGSLAGSLSVAFMRRRPAIFLIFGGCVLFTSALVGLSQARALWAALMAVMVLGFSWMLVGNTVNATIQANVTDQLRGRVMALYVTVFVGSVPLGGLLSGALADRFGASTTLLICAGLTLATIAIAAGGLRAGIRTGPPAIIHIDG